MTGSSGPAPQDGRVGRVAQFGVVDVVGAVAADVLLGDEIRRPHRRAVVRVGRRKQLADHRQRAREAPPRLGAAGRIAGNHERRLAGREVPGVRGRFRDLPAAGQADAVRVEQPPEPGPIRPPPQIGSRVDGALRRLQQREAAHLQDAVQHAPERHVVHRQRRLAGRAPHALIGIREHRVGDLPERGSAVGGVLVGRAFDLDGSCGAHRHPPECWRRGGAHSDSSGAYAARQDQCAVVDTTCRSA